MSVSEEIRQIKPGEELHRCPACGYERGFHTSFLSMDARADGKETAVKSTRSLYRVILICPECGARFDVGWRISFCEDESPVIRTTVLLR